MYDSISSENSTGNLDFMEILSFWSSYLLFSWVGYDGIPLEPSRLQKIPEMNELDHVDISRYPVLFLTPKTRWGIN